MPLGFDTYTGRAVQMQYAYEEPIPLSAEEQHAIDMCTQVFTACESGTGIVAKIASDPGGGVVEARIALVPQSPEHTTRVMVAVSPLGRVLIPVSDTAAAAIETAPSEGLLNKYEAALVGAFQDLSAPSCSRLDTLVLCQIVKLLEAMASHSTWEKLDHVDFAKSVLQKGTTLMQTNATSLKVTRGVDSVRYTYGFGRQDPEEWSRHSDSDSEDENLGS